MSPRFAEAVDPIFLGMLDLLERIEHNQPVSVDEQRMKLRGLIDQAEARLGDRPDWRLAKYAIVSWIDEMLIDAPWESRSWWENNALEVELFDTRNCFTDFYVRAKEASALPRRDALEVFYICVVLGFRGLYRDASAALQAEKAGLPPDVESWAQKMSMAIQLGQGRPPITEAPRPGEGAPPLEGKFQLVGMMLATVALTAIVAGVGWYLFSFAPAHAPSP